VVNNDALPPAVATVVLCCFQPKSVQRMSRNCDFRSSGQNSDSSIRFSVADFL